MLQGNLVSITAQQVLVMFLLILVGYLAVRFHILDAGARRSFSSLLVNIVVPAMIVNSYMTAFDPRSWPTWCAPPWSAWGCLWPGWPWRWRSPADAPSGPAPDPLCHHLFQRGLYGVPLIEALFGAEGLLYASIFNTFFNILIWTAGMAILDPKASQGNPLLELAKKPALLAVAVGLALYLGQIPVPRPDCPAHQPAGGHEYPPCPC